MHIVREKFYLHFGTNRKTGTRDSNRFSARILTTILLVQFSLVLRSQLPKEYPALISKGRQYYNAKDFRNAAATFSKAFYLAGEQTPVIDRHRAAFSYALAGNPDSTFFFLDNIAQLPVLTFDDYIMIAPDEDYRIIHKDPRWQGVTRKIFEKAREEFYGKAFHSDPGVIRKYMSAATAWSIHGVMDSTFFFIEQFSTSPHLTFDDVYELQDNNYLEENLKREKWQELFEKLYQTLADNYLNISGVKMKQYILLDNGHHTLHNLTNTYKGLGGALQKAGFIVKGFEGKFENESLKGAAVLLISNPHTDRVDSLQARARRENKPMRWSTAAMQPAFTDDEIRNIKEWVRKGGALFLILDHAPSGASTGSLAAAFGVESRNVGTYDSEHRDPTNTDTTIARSILFTRSHSLIGNHPILTGVDSVVTYTGQSLAAPAGAHPLLLLPSTARDEEWDPATRKMVARSAAGRYQAVALEYGKGRVVIFGEAAQTRTVNLSKRDRGNWRFLQNSLKWLLGFN